jgi:[ribosomal protein S5]-alanine N-acetyltransferase
MSYEIRHPGATLSLILETARLRLRSLRPSDLPFLVGLWADPEVTRYLGGPRDPAELAPSIQRIALDPEAEKFDLWPVEERQSGRLVGHCGLVEKEVEGRGEIELVYLIAATDWGRGYASEIAAALRDRAFGALGLDRLIALIHPENLASEKVALRVGMRLEREISRPGGNRRKLYAAFAPGPVCV